MRTWLIAGAVIVMGMGQCFPAAADPLMGDPLASDPLSGDPLAGDSSMSDPLAADPLAADPLAGDSSMSDPLAADPLAGDSSMSDPLAPPTSDPLAADPLASPASDPLAAPSADPLASDPLAAPAGEPFASSAPDPLASPAPDPLASPAPAPMAAPMSVAAGDGVPSMQLSAKADPLVKGTGFLQRKELMAQADEAKRAVRQLMQRLEDHKSSWYGKYLGLDAQLDGFYQQLGLSRGTLSEDIGDVVEALVADVMAANSQSPSTEFQEKIKAHQQKLRELEPAVVDVSRQEQLVIDGLRKLSEEVNKVHDFMEEINSKASELRGLESDEVANQYGQRITTLKAEAETAEKTIQDGVVKELSKAFVDTEARLGPVQQKVQALQQEGLDFSAKARALAPQRPKNLRPHLQQAAQPEAPVEEPAKKRSSDGFVSGMVKGTMLEKPLATSEEVAGKVWDGLKPVRNTVGTMFDGLLGTIMNLVRRLFGMGPITDELTGSGLDLVRNDDPVLETIRIERNQAHTAARNIVTQREALAEKEKLLDRLEAERVMQMDKREELLAELDKSYQRSNRELSWWGLGKRIMWKVGASIRRLFIPLRNALFGPKAPKVRQRQQQRGFVPSQPMTTAPAPGSAPYQPPRPRPMQYAQPVQQMQSMGPAGSAMAYPAPQAAAPSQMAAPQQMGPMGPPMPEEVEAIIPEQSIEDIEAISKKAEMSAAEVEAAADKFEADLEADPSGDELAEAEAEMAKLEAEMGDMEEEADAMEEAGEEEATSDEDA